MYAHVLFLPLVSEVFPRRVIEVELALFLEHHQRDGCDRKCDRLRHAMHPACTSDLSEACLPGNQAVVKGREVYLPGRVIVFIVRRCGRFCRGARRQELL